MNTQHTTGRDPVLLSNDDRRKIARKITAATGAPHDVAMAAAAIVRAPRNAPTNWTPSTDPDEVDAPHTGRHRVYVPLIDPNVFALARLSLFRADLTVPTLGDDGVYTASWNTPADLAAAFATAHHLTEDLLNEGADGTLGDHAMLATNGLDSWHEPLLLAPVRHVFADDTPTATRWFTLDGSVRVWALRRAIAARSGVSDHPYTDPASDWNADGQVSWRTFLAALRASSRPVPRVEDWTTLLWLGAGERAAADDATGVDFHLLRTHSM